jgi:hypothetical protein
MMVDHHDRERLDDLSLGFEAIRVGLSKSPEDCRSHLFRLLADRIGQGGPLMAERVNLIE